MEANEPSDQPLTKADVDQRNWKNWAGDHTTAVHAQTAIRVLERAWLEAQDGPDAPAIVEALTAFNSALGESGTRLRWSAVAGDWDADSTDEL